MKKQLTVLLTVAFIFVFSTAYGAGAADLADGTYTINFTVLKADNDSASMANDYFIKPANVTVKNGDIEMEVKVNQSEWIQEIATQWNGSYLPVRVTSEDKATDTRVIQFKAANLSTPLLSTMHVLIPEQEYDSKYTIRYAFDMNSLKAVNVAAKEQTLTPSSTKENNTTNTSTPNQKVSESTAVNADVQSSDPVENPQTGDSSKFGLLMAFVISSLLLIYKFRARKR